MLQDMAHMPRKDSCHETGDTSNARADGESDAPVPITPNSLADLPLHLQRGGKATFKELGQKNVVAEAQWMLRVASPPDVEVGTYYLSSATKYRLQTNSDIMEHLTSEDAV